MTLVMVWLAGELVLPSVRRRRCLRSSVPHCCCCVNIVWLGSHYRRRFRADNAISAACYFAGHFLIIAFAVYLNNA